MDKRIKDGVQEIAGIVSRLLVYLDEAERTEADAASRRAMIHVLRPKETEMTRFKDGSFRQRGNRLEYRFMLGGKQRTVYGNSKDDCYEKREKAIRDQDQPEEKPVTAREIMTLLSSIGSGQSPIAPGSAESFGDWLRRWYETYKRPHIKEHTRRLYEHLLAELIAGPLGSILLNELTGEGLQLYLNAETHSNKRTKLTHIIRPALAKAVRLRLLPYSPYDVVELPAHKSRPRTAFTFDEQTAVLQSLSGKYLAAFWVLTCTGLRPGEFLGLNYATDVDFEAGKILVNGGIDVISGARIDSPKTENGRRVVRFLPDLIPHLKQCAAENLTYNMLRLYFGRLFTRLGIDASLYTCRHTFITLCAYVGIAPKYIQRLAGHASIVTTFDIYTDAIDAGTSPLLPYFEKLAKLYPKIN